MNKIFLVGSIVVVLLLFSTTAVFALNGSSIHVERAFVELVGTLSGVAEGQRVVQTGIEVWEEVLTGYEPVYERVNVTTCVNDSLCSSELVLERSTEEHGPAQYSRKQLLSFNVSGVMVEHRQEHSGCFVCPTDHSTVVCYGYQDGFSEHINDKWKCSCKSGTSCKILDTFTGDVEQYHTDGGVI